jgi:hypothetical protein
MYGWIIFWVYGVGAAVMVIAALVVVRTACWLIKLARGFYLASCYRAKFGEWPEVVTKTKTGYQIKR